MLCCLITWPDKSCKHAVRHRHAFPVASPGAVPTGNNLGVMTCRVQACFLVSRTFTCAGFCGLNPQVWHQRQQKGAQIPCTELSAAPPVHPCAIGLPPAHVQVGQLNVPTLPTNYREAASQMSFVQMQFP